MYYKTFIKYEILTSYFKIECKGKVKVKEKITLWICNVTI